MSAYDDMATDELVDELCQLDEWLWRNAEGKRSNVVSAAIGCLAAYEPIVAALRDLPATAVYDPATNTCRLCDWIDGEHTDTCPWWLAQQTKDGEA